MGRQGPYVEMVLLKKNWSPYKNSLLNQIKNSFPYIFEVFLPTEFVFSDYFYFYW